MQSSCDRCGKSQPSRSRSALALVIVAACALALVPASAATTTADYTHARGLGPVKAAGKGLSRVQLRDGSTVLTHGLDQKPPASAQRTVAFPGPERQPVCASDNFVHVLYGYPAGTPNRLAQLKAAILAEMKRVDALLNEDALASGGHTADLKVACDDGGEIRVDSFQSSESSAATTFSGVVSAARAQGFAAPNADYVIFFDTSAPPACGTGTYTPDERLSADNQNNSGGDYAVVYSGCWDDRTALHEIAHNQGAVQYSAPYSTGSGAHCTDDYDIMCYSDGGDRDAGMQVFCPDKMHFDCRYDTYFDTQPEPGEYLASHWNLGSPLNRFIALDGAGPSKPTCSDGLDNDGDGLRDYPGDPGCAAAGDGDEANPPAPPPVSTLPYGTSGLSLEPVPQLPRLTMAAARRYARQRIRRRSRRASAIRASCARRTRTSAICRVRWRIGRRVHYRGKMLVKYRHGERGAVLAATTRVRRVTR